ncbi:MAG: alpha/beta hydrolase [Novosphingobium sp.]
MTAGVIPPERPGYLAPADLAERRAQFAKAVAAGAWATDRSPVEAQLAGRRVLRFRPDGEPKGYLLHFHGGGYRLGGPEWEAPFASALAERCDVEVVCPQYRLAPEHPFPGALIDARACLDALRVEIGDVPLVVSGDSAGAGLASALGVLASLYDGPSIDGLVLLSPFLDLTISAASYAENAGTDPLFSRESAEAAAELYLQGFDPRHPLVSALHAPLQSYPPVLISVGTGEVLRDDSTAFHRKLVATGADSALCAVDGMEHVAVVRGMELPGASETFEAIAGFVDRIVQR